MHEIAPRGHRPSPRPGLGRDACELALLAGIAPGEGLVERGFDTTAEQLACRHKLFGYTEQDIDRVIRPMAGEGRPAVDLMFERQQQLANITRQLSDRAQAAAESPADGGKVPAANDDKPASSPILTERQFAQLRSPSACPLASIPLLFDVKQGAGELERRVDAIAQIARDSVLRGAEVLILSDRYADEFWAPVPALLAVAAVHRAVVAARCRVHARLVVATGEAREPHHTAALVEFGASGVFPYLAYETAASLANDQTAPAAKATERYRDALDYGVRKILANSSRCNDAAVVDGEFAGRYYCSSRTATTISDIGREVMRRQHKAFSAHRIPLSAPLFGWAGDFGPDAPEAGARTMQH